MDRAAMRQRQSVQWNYDGKIALVAGASSGIGQAIAERLLSSGAQVAVAARRQNKLEEWAARFDGRAIAVPTDITVPYQVAAMVRQTVEAFGRLDLAFNIAAAYRSGSVVDLSEDDWDAVHENSLRGIFLCLKHEAAQMIRQRTGGAIVNVSSVNAHMPAHGGIAYCTAKAGLDMLGRNAALDLAEHGIRVNTLAPGLVATEKLAPLLAVPGVVDSYIARIPVRRPATAEDMTGPALFLGSDEADYITGSTLVVDGGWSLTGYPDLRPALNKSTQ